MLDPSIHLGFLSWRWYSFTLLLAVFIPYFLIRKKLKQKEEFDNLTLFVVPLGIVGARLYHVLDKWFYYQHHLVEIFFIWQGGLGIFGGLITGLLVCWVYCRSRKIDIVNLLDQVVPYLLLGQAIGRVGNYFNSEAFGPPTSLPWGIYINGTKVHPTFFYEAFWDLIGFFILMKFAPKLKKLQPSGWYLVIYGSGRLLAEFFRIDTLQIQGVKIGYVISLLLILVGLYLLLKRARMVKHFGG